MKNIILAIFLLLSGLVFGQTSTNGSIAIQWVNSAPIDTLNHLVLEIELNAIASQTDSIQIVITNNLDKEAYRDLIPKQDLNFPDANRASIEITEVLSDFYRYDINVYRQGLPVLILSRDQTN